MICRDPECPHPDLCAACGEEIALYDYEERTRLDSAGRPYRRREPRLVRLCGGCLDEVAEDALAVVQMRDRVLRAVRGATPMTPDAIISITASYFGLKPADLTSKDNRPRIVQARQIAMYVCRELYGIRVVEGKRLAGSEVEAAVKQISAAAKAEVA